MFTLQESDRRAEDEERTRKAPRTTAHQDKRRCRGPFHLAEVDTICRSGPMRARRRAGGVDRSASFRLEGRNGSIRHRRDDDNDGRRG